MGDISMRGKGRALKMQSGGSTTERRKKERENKIEKMFGPKTKRPGLTIKPLIPKPVKPMPRDPKKVPEFESMPRPRPLPRDLRDLEKYMMKIPKRVTPAMKKDGGKMKSLADKFSKAITSMMGIPATKLGVSAEQYKKALEKAKKMKPTGRLNMDDIKKALGMMELGAAKKTEPKIKGRLGGPKTQPKIKRTLRKLI
jgi:hypothetical protein